MLGQFTWGQFLSCYGAVSLLWYLGLLFTAYRKEIMALLGRKGERSGNGVLKLNPGSGPVKDQTAISVDSRSAFVQGQQEQRAPGSIDGVAGEELMGKVSPPQGVERIETAGLGFVPAQDGDGDREGGADDRDFGGGLYWDLTAGIREIYSILAANDGNKQDFFGMVSELKSEMGPVGSSPCITRVNAYIRDTAPFAISSEELESLWD